MAKHQAKRWRFNPGERDSTRIAEIARFAKIPVVLAKLLVSRGVQTPNEAAQHLDPKLTHLYEPNLLPGCARAAEFLVRAVREGKKIAVYGDYDVDGMTATSILYKCLRLENPVSEHAKPIFFIPNRMTDGYGLNRDSIRDLKERDVDIIVTVDCGITAVEEVELARELGMTVILTDHHQPGETLPKAEAIVHPDLFGHAEFDTRFFPYENDAFLKTFAHSNDTQKSVLQVRPPSRTEPYPFPHLSGAGVAFKLAWAICQRFAQNTKVGPRRQSFILEAIELAAIGTIADVVSLRDENRVIVVQGLATLRDKPSVGLEALLKVSKLFGRSIVEDDVGYSLAPRLNAAGRLDQAWIGVDLLTTENPESARETAIYLDELNNKRRELENKMQRDASSQLKKLYPDADAPPPAIVLASHDWHPGIIGIVAGKLAERHNAPTVLIALSKTGVGSGTGSARGISNVPEFNLHDALSQCSDHLERFGGHAGAAGLRISPLEVESFRDAFCQVVDSILPLNCRIPELPIDSEEPLSIFTLQNVRDLYRLAPFGTDNPSPIFCTSGVTFSKPPQALGKAFHDKEEQRPVHLALHVEQDGRSYRVVAFNYGEYLDELQEMYDNKTVFDFAFRVKLNLFNGFERVDLHLVDWRPSSLSRGRSEA